MASQEIETLLSFKDEFSSKFNKAMGNADKTTKKVGNSLEKTKKSILGLKTVVASFIGAAALGGLAKSFLRVGNESEGLALQFEVLLKSADAAKERMEELSKFASTTPFQLGEISKASKILQTLGGTSLATGDGLRLVGDAAAISGENIQDLAVHVGRAYSGLKANRPIGESAARLQELGLVSGETRNEVERLQQAARGNEAWEVLKTALEANKGSMEKLSGTVGGLTSTIKDQLDAAIRTMLDSGVWDLLRDVLTNVRNEMEKLLKGDFFKKLGVQILDLISHVNKAVLVLRILFNVFQNGISVIQNFGTILFNVFDTAMQTIIEFVKIGGKGLKGIWQMLKGDFSGAVDTTTGAFDNLKDKVIQNNDDIKKSFDSLIQDVLDNDKDMIAATEQAANAQLKIEKIKYDSLKKMSETTKTKVIIDKQEEVAKVFELDQKLTNDLILLKAEGVALDADLRKNDFSAKLAALEVQKNAELEILGSQLAEELRMAGDNELKKTQLAEKAAVQASIIEKKHTALSKAENKARTEANMTGLQTLTGALSSFFNKSKELASIDALVNTYAAANKALAQGGIFGVASAVAVTAVGLKNVAKIQGLNNGGIVQGLGTRDSKQPTFLTAGEGVLTKGVTNKIGSGGIDNINNGNAPTNNVTNNVTYSPTINASNTDGFKEMLDNNMIQFGEFFENAIDKGVVNR